MVAFRPRLVGTFAALSISVLMLTPFASAYSEVHLQEKHVSVMLPTGWEYETEVSYAGTTCDLEFSGPSSLGLNPRGCLVSWEWTGPVNSESLAASLQAYLDEVSADPSYSEFYLDLPIRERPLNGLPTVDASFYVGVGDPESDGYYLYERVVMTASGDWAMAWRLNVTVVDAMYLSNMITIKNIVNSLSVDEKDSGTSLMWTLLAGVIAVVALALIAVWWRGRRKHATPAAPPQPGSRDESGHPR